jgi:uncharacterized protein with HEPN domain
LNENRLADYLGHIQQAATDACSFVEGLSKEEFLTDKRTQQAVIMSLIIIGEAATKLMDRYVVILAAIRKFGWRSPSIGRTLIATHSLTRRPQP